MKILLVTTHLEFGGITTYVVSLAKALTKRGHRVFVASSGGEFVEKLELASVPHIEIPIRTKFELSPKVFTSARMLHRFVTRRGVEIIHAQTRVAQVASAIISKYSQVPYISTCHGFFKARFGRRLFGCWGYKTIAISEAVSEHLVNDFKIKKSNIELIYNGIDLDRFKDYNDDEKESFRKNLGIKKGPLVGIIARLSSVKGHKYLIEAMKYVIGQIPDAQLLIIGEGGIKADLVEMTNKFGISSNVYFFDSIVNTAEPLSVMDVFVLPSIHEGLGLSIMEALAMKKAVVASDVGGINTIVKNNVTGFLVPSRNANALAESIIKLLKDRSLRDKFGRDGRRLIEESFPLDLMAEKTEKVYKDVKANIHF
ncbi:MAG: hypothetical protein COS99_03670 [Candidatus Omnitrophica bacterium CG07_land_8_20_14_0_80_42_15]|uniref:Glycosyltransferase family 1 protein n=1 Tax=Candidatus Aquitaenariimonas noxiae TaxID=1974741 RepID=A0A2J0KZC0_9BACT|nr:MAG: hypothetical protein COS99_03670 [Candidatus Omnitrophica bacterium CG07_land_8_20_14_0_80_42_15]